MQLVEQLMFFRYRADPRKLRTTFYPLQLMHAEDFAALKGAPDPQRPRGLLGATYQQGALVGSIHP